jgi:hypothetical protein
MYCIQERCVDDTDGNNNEAESSNGLAAHACMQGAERRLFQT